MDNSEHMDISAPQATSRRHQTAGWGYSLLARLHFYAGLLVGPFIFIAALSGALFALTPQIDGWLYQTELTATTAGEPRPLADQIAAARRYLGDEPVLAAVRPSAGPGQTSRIMFQAEELQAFEHRAVFVDPVSLGVRGELVVYGTSGTLPFRTWIDYLHRHLHLREAGRYYSELAASWLWLVALGGLILWWRRRQRRSSRGPSRDRRQLRQWHSRIGVVLLLAFLFFSITGLTWSRWAGDNIAELRARLDWGTPAVNADLTRLPSPGQGHHNSHADHHLPTVLTGDSDKGPLYDAVLAQARAAGIDATKLEIRPSPGPARAWTVAEIDRSWPTQVDVVAIDPSSLEVVDQVRFSDFPLAAKLTRWGIDAHMGILFGLPNQIFVAICALGLCALILLGYRMWWLHRPTRAISQRIATQRLWADLRRAPLRAQLLLAAGAIGLGWFAPVFGASFAAFLCADGLLAWREWRARAIA